MQVIKLKLSLLVAAFSILFNFHEANATRFWNDSIYRPNIKTVQLYRQGWDLTFPAIAINSEDKLMLAFDDLSEDITTYYYSIIHCNADWTESSVPANEYLGGFTENPLTDYSQSFNTLYHYLHYSLVFPNENMQPRLSGNYILLVYKDSNTDSIILSKRFLVTDPQVEIIANTKRPTLTKYQKAGQEIDFSIKYGSYPINDPFNEINVVILQNYHWDHALSNLKPQFVRDKELIYNDFSKNIFQGGNEFRSFDVSSIRYQTQYVRRISFEAPYYHFILTQDEARPFKVYFFDNDLNGRFAIRFPDGQRPETEADYVYVHFNLPYQEPLVDGNVYVYGALSQWQCNPENEMKYNMESKAYELKLLLKQGYYNYQYAYLKEEQTIPDLTYLEGSHYETENDYILLVYQRPMGSRYDKLIGIQYINTLKNL